MARTGRGAVGTFLVLVSLGLLGVGWRLTETDRFFLFTAARTTGRVEAHEPYQREGRKPEERYRMVVSFATETGDRIRFRSISSYGRPPYAVGEAVGVRYDEANPTRARVYRRIELLAPVVIWMGAVLMVGLLGIAIVWLGPKDASGTSRRPAHSR